MIDFEDGTNGAAIGSFYSESGVAFSNARFVSSAGHFGASNLSFAALQGPGPSTPIVIVFERPVSDVRLAGVDLSHHGFIMRTYDANGNLIAQAGYSDGSSNGHEITVGAVAPPPIKRIAIYQPLNTQGTSGGLLLDNLTIKR